MISNTTHASEVRSASSPGSAWAVRVVWLLWQAIRLPLLALLLILEPFAALVLSAAAFVGVVAACVLKLSRDLPHFPFWGMIGFSVGCMLLLMAYHTVVRLLSR